jgi:hypothetical protein
MRPPVAAETLFPVEADVLLEGAEQSGGGAWFVTPSGVWIEQEVDVVRHDHVAHETDVVLTLQEFQTVNDDLFHGIMLEERQAAMTGNRPEVYVPRFVDSSQARGHGYLITIRLPHR